MITTQHVKYASAFFAGSLVASAVTYFVTRERFERRTREEIDSVKKHYKKFFDENFTKIEVSVEEEPAEAAKTPVSIFAPPVVPSTNAVDYARVGSDEDAEPEIGIRIITESQYVDEEPEYTKNEWVYWKNSGVFSAENAELVNEPVNFISDDGVALCEIARNTIFIRNNNMDEDYKIVMNFSDEYDEGSVERW